MTEQAEEAPQLPEREIEFRGRKIWVKMPRPEQLLVWQRVLKQLQTTEPSTGSEVMVLLERGRKVLDSILVNRADKDWMDDEMLEGTLTFQDVLPMINDAAEAFAQDGNHEERRAVKKAAKKAARKAPAPRS